MKTSTKMVYAMMTAGLLSGSICCKEVPIPENGTGFIPIDKATPNDYYLKTAGKYANKLKSTRVTVE